MPWRNSSRSERRFMSMRILPDFELTQPDKPRDRAARIFCQQGVETRPHGIDQPPRDPRCDPPLCDDQRICAKALNDRDTGQNGLGRPALLDKAPGQIVVGPRRLGCIFQPSLQIPRPSAREHLVTVQRSQDLQMFTAGFLTHCIICQIIGLQAELRGDEAAYRQRDHLARSQQTTGISQRAKLQGKAEAVVWTASGADDFQVIVRQRVSGAASLPQRQADRTLRHVAGQSALCDVPYIFSFQGWFVIFLFLVFDKEQG